jgi:hypothetical protein
VCACLAGTAVAQGEGITRWRDGAPATLSERAATAARGDETMAEKMTRGQVQDLLAKFATDNPKYREALIANPKAVIEKQFAASLGSVTVKAVVETADTTYVVVPHVAGEGELSDADLEKVAGGKGDIEVNCHQYGAANISMMQINL